MAKQPALLTYEDYLHLPADRRWELVKGVPRVVPSPNRRHQEVLGRLFVAVFQHVAEHGGGAVFFAPFDAVLGDNDVFQPDIVFVSDADADVVTDDNIRGNPTWVVEVLSNPYYERDKFARYELAGVPEYWLLNPYEDTLAVSLLEGSTYGGPVTHVPPAAVRPACLPALAIDLTDVLRR
jgi:Uma2 family endonuclease